MRVLSVDGGGYLGLATAAFIEGLEHHFGTKAHDRFDLFCGTSTGAIIALALAAGLSGKDVRELYETLGPEVFTPQWSRLKKVVSTWHSRAATAMLLGRPKYSNEPLRRSLDRWFGRLTLGDLLAKGKKVLVTSYCVSNGQPRVFKTDHSPELTRHNGYLVRDVAMASAAAPLYFPLVELKSPVDGASELFWDGGLVANHPAILGYAEALAELGIPPSQLSLLSLSTPRTELAEHGARLDSPGLSWLPKLSPIMLDSGGRITGEALKRIVNSYPADSRPRYERVELSNVHNLLFDDASREATAALVQEGSSKASQGQMRVAMKPFFAEG